MRTRCFRLAMSPGASRAEALIPRRGAGGSVIVAIIAHGTSPRPVRPGPWAVAIALEWEYGIPGPKSTAGRSILSGRELFNPPPPF